MKLIDQKLQLDLIRAYWQSADTQWNYPAYRRPYNWMIHTLSGSGWVELSDRKIELRANSLIVVPLNQLCNYHCSEPMKLGASAFTLQLSSGLDVFELYHPPQQPIILKDPQLIRQIIEAQDSNSGYFNAIGAMYQLLALLTEHCKPRALIDQHYQRLDIVLSYIDDNLAGALNVPDIASIHGTSTAHFSRWFSKVTGTSPKQFIIDKRIDQASKLLLFTQLKIELIAYRVGFEDPLYFSKCFKKIIGITPSQYRKTRNYDAAPLVENSY